MFSNSGTTASNILQYNTIGGSQEFDSYARICRVHIAMLGGGGGIEALYGDPHDRQLQIMKLGDSYGAVVSKSRASRIRKHVEQPTTSQAKF